MNNRFFLGRYMALNTFVHRLDARLKLVATIVLMIASLIVTNVISASLLAFITLLLIIVSCVPFKVLYRGLKPILAIIVFTAFLQVFFVQGGKIYVSLGVFNVTASGVNNAIATSGRLLFIVIISTLLTLTTQPLELANAVEFFMRPFHRIINVQLWALMFSVAIRFIPTLMISLQKLMVAQRSRGVRFDKVGLIQRAKAFVPILIPLFISTYKRSIELGTAMMARGFDDSIKRTKYRQLQWRTRDTWSSILFMVLLIIIFLGNLV